MHRSGHFHLNCLSIALASLLPGLATAQTAPAPQLSPAKLPDSGTQADLVENPVTFRLVQLAFVETSLKLVDEAIVKAGGQTHSDAFTVDRYKDNNELMNRKGGGPVPWEKFYGKTADKFYMRVPGSLTTSASLVRKQRPPQFNYIYKANNDHIQKAKDEIAALGGKIEKLREHKRQLEHDQVALWGQISGALVAQSDIEAQPLYCFHLKADGVEAEPSLADRAAAIEAFAQYLRVLDKAAGFVDQNMSKDQALALATLKQNVETARKELVGDLANAISADSSVREQTEPLSDLAKRLAVVTNSAVETRDAAMEADAVGDDAQKMSSRGLLQTAMVDFADKTATLDDSVIKLAADWNVRPITDKPLPEVRLVNLTSSLAAPSVSPTSPVRKRQGDDRSLRVAKAVFAVGGTVILDVDGKEAKYTDINSIPTEPWTIQGIDLHGITKVSDKELRCLDETYGLKKLWLMNTSITDAGLRHVTGLSELEDLGLGGNAITDDGLKQLSGLKNLRSLGLNNTKVTNKGMKSLSSLKHLEKIHIAGTKVTDRAVKSALPNCEIVPPK